MSVAETSAAGGPADDAVNAPAVTDARLVPLAELVETGAIDLLTVDVFDTILFRRCPDPTDVFWMVGERLIREAPTRPAATAEAFRDLRRMAEERAREEAHARTGEREIDLEAVYRWLPVGVLESGRSKDEVRSLELRVERELLVPDPEVVALLRRARGAGVRVVAVSDTYFSPQELGGFLTHPGMPADLVDRIYASSAYGTGKTGGLFPIVLREEGVSAERVAHLGDNRAADVTTPEALGIRAHWFRQRTKAFDALLGREHRRMADRVDAAGGDRGVTALRAKLDQRIPRSLPERHGPFWRYGATIVGPLLTALADRAVQRAEELGLSEVQCLMREGELLGQLVDAAATARGSRVRARRLWASRQVGARAEIEHASRGELERLLGRRSAPTVRGIQRALGIEDHDLGLDLPADAPLVDGADRDLLLARLADDTVLRDTIATRARALRSRLVRSVEPRVQDGRLLVLDLGWAGTIQASLQHVLRIEGVAAEVHGLYLLTDGRAADHLLQGLDVEGLLGAVGAPYDDVGAVMRSPEIIEQACMPELGSQLDLDEHLEPVLGAHGEPEAQTHERRALQAGIRAFQEEWLRLQAPLDRPPGLHEGGRDVLRRILVRSVAEPTEDEASLLGRWQHDENFGSDARDAMLATRFVAGARHIDPRSLRETPMSDLYWPFGLAVIGDPSLAAGLAAGSAGIVPWEAFSAPSEDTGDIEIYVDNGWGFVPSTESFRPGRRNVHGLSWARGRLVGESIRALRLDLIRDAGVYRVDAVRVTALSGRGGEPVVLDFTGEEFAGRWRAVNVEPLGGGLFRSPRTDPQHVLELEALCGGPVHDLVVEVAFAAIGSAAVAEERRTGASGRALQRAVAVERRTGLPVARGARAGVARLRRLRGS